MATNPLTSGADTPIPTIERVDVELTFDPPWNQEMMSESARLDTGMF